MSKKPKVSPIEAAKSLFPQLAAETNELSSAVGDLARTFSGVERSLRRIGLNVSAWHQIAGGQDDDSGYVWSRDIGYTRINHQWRIALRDYSQEIGQPPETITWPFADAPPWMCLEAAGKIPGLLEELLDRTRQMTKNIRSKSAEVAEVASAIEALASEVSQIRK